ncbi:sulfide quinone-reductase [Beauveria brongniartii RCEF 3172]|uniref:Sulfide quinone-reductase n=1 Tax=Beauveria brongniartii RCEF 3172 TaxID=1081107 RepID=A0A167D4C3_9HYPO|nr:sulfide quinone-reductase [Beauveria brongniartii RCEF 3172]
MMHACSSRTVLSRAACRPSRVVVVAAPRSRTLATATTAHPVVVGTTSSRSHKVVIVGAGAAGASVSHQLLRSGRYARGDIAVVDPAPWHHYQPGWTLVGGGLARKQDLRLRTADVLDPKLALYDEAVRDFQPAESTVTLAATGQTLRYEQLVVCPGIHIDYASIKGLPEALADPGAPVSTVYGYEGADKVFGTVEGLKKGRALFTQPKGLIKCAGAPQKVMWLALDYWKRAGRYRPGSGSGGGGGGGDEGEGVGVTFATAAPAMFGVPKYSAALEALRVARGVEGLFGHDLVEVDGDVAVFAREEADGISTIRRRFDLLHAVPKMGPHAFVARSPLADAATGLVDVDAATLRHKRHGNVWALGDAAGLPTAKTAAAVTAQAPVLVANLLAVAEQGRKEEDEKEEEEGPLPATYDGYTSCPLTTEYGKVLLAEFKYGGEPKETFARLGVDQAVPNRLFYHLKKDFFPWVYKKHMIKGTWGGPKGFLR